MLSEIKFKKTLKDNVYIIDITMEHPVDGDYKEAIHDYGEEYINLGGEIRDENDDIVATLSLKNIKISELVTKPIQQKFSTSQFVNAKDVASLWYEQTKTKIEDYIASKIAQIDDFSSEETVNI